ncbi:MAG: Ig-like domain-containing protein [Gemmatimonadales bacterium]|nr:Ig-like domain-containing protein [Gemmatimonadales bacterium]
MRISPAPFSLRFSLIPFRGALVVGLLALGSCGEGEDQGCGGPFCVIPPGRPEATRLRSASGNGQTGAPGRELQDPLAVLVTDGEDRPIPDVQVTFMVDPASGNLSAPSVRSDYQGRAEVTWTLGPALGPQTVVAVATGELGAPLDGSPLTLTAQGDWPLPARLVLQQAPSGSTQNGSPLERQPVVVALDANGDPVPEVNVTAAIMAGGGELHGTTLVSTDAAGRATYTDLAILGVAGTRALGFSVTEPPLETLFATVEVRAGASSQLVGNQPLVYEATVNSPVSPSPSVVVRDDAGNPVPGVAVTFAADLDASVSPASLTTDELGVAQVTSWTVGRAAGVRYSLSAQVESSGGAPVVFFADAKAGAAGKLEITVQPSATARSGTPLDRQPVIRVVDQLGNPAPQAGVTITATLSSGPSGSLQNASATTNGVGRASFRGLTLSGLVGNYRLSFSAPSLEGVTSSSISLAAATPSRLAVVRQPSAAGRSRVPLSVQPTVQLQDARGNPVAQAGVEVVASLASGGGTLGGGSRAVTGSDGRATYADLTITGSPGARTLRFTSASPATSVVSSPVTLPAVATVAVVTAPSSPVVVGSTLTDAVRWSLTDAGGQPVPDAPAGISASPGNSVDPVSTSSDESGMVELQSWTVSQTAGEHSVELGVADAPISRVIIAAVAGTASRLQKISGDGQSAPVNSQLPEPLVVRVVDEFGNGASGVTVQWRTCEGIGDYDAVTDVGGYASAFQDTGPEPGTFCGMASSAGLADSPVQFSFTATAAEGSVRALRRESGVRSRPSAPRAPDR